MTPIITLIGRQNVGKSTLFNRLTHTNNALVANFSGLTRDRQYGFAKFKNNEFIIIDTGGIYENKNHIEMKITNQSLLAINEADIIFFIVDARSNLMPEDQSIAKYLYNYKKITFLIVNKIDGLNYDIAISDFYSLGFSKIHAITATHGYGIKKLIENALIPFFYKKEKKYNIITNNNHTTNIIKENNQIIKNNNNFQNNNNLNNIPIKLAIVGCPNVGKSTLINFLLKEERLIVYDTPGTTRDSIYIPMTFNNYKYILIDTAGVRKRNKIIKNIEKFSIIKTLKAIKDSHIVLLLIDACKGISNQDLSLLNFILNNGRSIVIAINKWDNINKKNQISIKNKLNFKLSFINFVQIHFISALYGNGIKNLFQSILKTYNSSIHHINTSLLNKIMHMAINNNQPPLLYGRRIKLKYAHSGGYNPLIIVIHGNQVNNLSNTYKRYLLNYFCYSLKIIGTPVRIIFKENKNPFLKKI